MSFGNVPRDLAVSSVASGRSCGGKTVTGYFAGDIRQTGELVQYQSVPGRWVTAKTEGVPSTQLGNPYVLPNSLAPGIYTYAKADGTGKTISVTYDQLTNGSALAIYKGTNGIYSPSIVPLPTDATGLCGTNSSSLSKNGELCAFGSKEDNSGVGAVWIYALDGGSWVQQGLKITGQGAIGNGGFGAAVALSGAGDKLVIGAPNDDGIGAAYIYQSVAPGDWEFVAKLVGTPLLPGSNFGWDVDFSENGSTVAVGAYLDANGSAFVYTNIDGTWTEQAKLRTQGHPTQGYGVSLSGNGNVLAVSASESPLVYYRSGTEWSIAIEPPRPVDLVGGLGPFEYGWCALSYDANTLLVSSIANNNGTGASWIYTQGSRQGDGPGTWTQNGPAMVGTGAPANAQQGFCEMSGDGKVVVIPDNNLNSLLWVFV